MNVAIQGYKGSYHDIVKSMLLPESELIACDTFHDVVLSVKEGTSDYGIMAIENSIYGDTAAVLELRTNFDDLEIIAEHTLDINHCLVAHKNNDTIETISSHQVALGQCRVKIHEKYAEATLVESSDTALSAKEIAEGDVIHTAAIASRSVVEIFPNLVVIDDDITDYEYNNTRFIVFCKKGLGGYILKDKNCEDKTTALMLIPNYEGSLLKAMTVLQNYDINYSSITANSFRHDSRGETVLVPIEFTHSWHDERLAGARRELEKVGVVLKSLGSYKQGDVTQA